MKKNSLIIIIDDNSVNNYICEKIIKQYSPLFTVKSFVESEKGLDAILEYKNEINFLILDLFMPICNGFDILNRMKLEGIELPTLILTSSLNEEDKKMTEKFPFIVAWLEKPATYQLLEGILNKNSPRK